MKGKSYEEMLSLAGLTSLTERRKRGDMIEVFKMLCGFDNVDWQGMFTYVDKVHGLDTRAARMMNLAVPKCRLDIRKYFFTNRVVMDWNALPLGVRMAGSVEEFKRLYDRNVSQS